MTTKAFDELVCPHFDALYRRAYRLTRDVGDAEDLVQEICLRAHLEFDALASMDNPKAWLFKVLYRLFVDLARHNARSPIRSLNLVQVDDASVDMASAEPGPAEHAETDFLRASLERALKVLGREERVLLVLHEVEGYTLNEIEEVIGLPPSTVKSRLHRARVRLGRLMRTAESEPVNNARGSNNGLPRYQQSVG